MTVASNQDKGVAAWAALLRAHAALVPVLDRELHAATGLPLAWYDVLLELDSADGKRLRMSDLGERVVLSRTRVSRLVDELIAAGLVTREANPADGRSSFAALTEEGRKRFMSGAPVYLRAIRREFSAKLDDTELDTIVVALGKVIAAGPPAQRT